MCLGTHFTEDTIDVTQGFQGIIHNSKTSSHVYQVSSHSGTRPKPGVHKIGQKSRSQLEVPGARRVTCGKLNTTDPQIIGSTAQIQTPQPSVALSLPPLNHTTVVQLQNAVYLIGLRA